MSNFGGKIIEIQISDQWHTVRCRPWLYILYLKTFERTTHYNQCWMVRIGPVICIVKHFIFFIVFYCDFSFHSNYIWHKQHHKLYSFYMNIFFGRQQCTQSKYLTVDMLLKFPIIIRPLQINCRVPNRKLHQFCFSSLFSIVFFVVSSSISHTHLSSLALRSNNCSSNMIATAQLRIYAPFLFEESQGKSVSTNGGN